MTTSQTSVLVVDDDNRIMRMMEEIMESEGHRVISASDGQSALDLFNKEQPDLVLLDIMMPGLDGYEVCRRIRSFSRIPIIMVTARGNDEEKIQGLDAGADDYIAKPFSFDELAARVRAVLRRSVSWDNQQPEPLFSCHELEIDFYKHRVTLNGKEINLTATEYRLLCYLARNAERVLTPDQILESLWGDDYLGEDHLLQVNIASLRKKLGEDIKTPRFIVTKHGMGYMFERQATSR